MSVDQHSALPDPKDARHGLVSIIVIFFNGEPYITEAIDSVLAQDCSNWELLLVNDGSIDGSADVARRYARECPHRVHYLEHPGGTNRGMSASRNLGLATARGEYVMFLDADDYWPAYVTGHARGVMERHPKADAAFGRTIYWYDWDSTKPQAFNLVDYEAWGGLPAGIRITPPGYVVQFLQNFTITPGMGSIIVRRSALGTEPWFENSFRGVYEDLVFQAKLGFHCNIYIDGKPWGWYRQHPCSTMKRTSVIADLAGRRRFYAWLAGYARRQGVESPSLKRALSPLGRGNGYVKLAARSLRELARRPAHAWRRSD